MGNKESRMAMHQQPLGGLCAYPASSLHNQPNGRRVGITEPQQQQQSPQQQPLQQQQQQDDNYQSLYGQASLSQPTHKYHESFDKHMSQNQNQSHNRETDMYGQHSQTLNFPRSNSAFQEEHSTSSGNSAEDFDIERRFSVAPEDMGGADLSIEQFDLLKMLGKGSFGKVMLVRHKLDGNLYALKILKKSVLLRRNQIAHTQTERRVLQAVRHPFIVELKYAWQTRDKLYLVTDYAPGGELFFWLKRERVFNQARVQLYAAELVLALEHLHSKNVVYRDLKPENILIDAAGHIKLTDFGLSKESVTGFGPEGGTQTFCGTPEYLAPEILSRTGHGKAVDWWSLGTLLYEMCAGLPPFYDENIQDMYTKIMNAPLQFPHHFLPETRSLLSSMLTRDVTHRLGYNGAAEIKAHPFFSGLDWNDVYARRTIPMFRPPRPTHAADVRNFEDEFTCVPAVDDSIDDRHGVLSTTAAEKTHFEGFTFNGDTHMLGSTHSNSLIMDGGSFSEIA